MADVRKVINFFVGDAQPIRIEDFNFFTFKVKGMNGALKKRLISLLQEARAEVMAVLKDGHTFFIADDGHTLAELERLGHPYSRKPKNKKGHGGSDSPGVSYKNLGHQVPDAIHIQKSRGTSLFDDIKEQDFKDYLTFRIVFGNQESFYYWQFLKEGTSTMVPRPLDQEIIAMFGAKIEQKVINGMKDVFKGGELNLFNVTESELNPTADARPVSAIR